MNITDKKLGWLVKDVVTNLKGVTTSVSLDLTGCIQFIVQPQGNGETKPESMWIDEGRLTFIRKITSRDECKDSENQSGACDKPIK